MTEEERSGQLTERVSSTHADEEA